MRLLSALVLAALSVLLPGCGRMQDKTLISFPLASGSEASIYKLSDAGFGFLGLSVKPPNKNPDYFWLDACSLAHFEDLRIRIESSAERDLVWIHGTSRYGHSFNVTYDDSRSLFYKDDFVAENPSPSRDMSGMSFRGSQAPPRGEAPEFVIFDGVIQE